ncbi:hypothetical protein Ngar_c09480 [Candidatus Nitrososphaera gargensis Ga9.2]|uniref:Uncharacterized protein n=1 Tax=Nitrososphaera gargensis (strain Ga9.2) TaxID=1237085 RepID=K0IDT4_NITGG|nr:hypothetical protein [Candidatus Nitrososphaera gargensis]AFU57890.1 hypothetical protein Ngar_c09480 [Candidatus Nitrososphaera gargensis Ga9.2]
MNEGYYHVQITKKSGQRAYEIDLAESQLLERIVNPIKNKSDFMCGHSLLNRSEIENVRITRTLEHSSKLKWAKFNTGMDRWIGNVDARPFEYYVVRSGEDVTTNYLDSSALQERTDESVSKSESKRYSELFHDTQFSIDEKLCFVLMPFNEEYKFVYNDIIKPVVNALGLEAKRADDIFEPAPIIQGIWEHINKANVIIADLSGRNPNVFYEVGLSHALNP